ncbi:MAG: hypothetical protein O2U61_04535 [Candidatus Bathyarchaeota archaeon]|nr:hypothetical protein [Candidatus Bathyarchaeota archaeon]
MLLEKMVALSGSINKVVQMENPAVELGPGLSLSITGAVVVALAILGLAWMLLHRNNN